MRNLVTGHSLAGITVQPLNEFAPSGNRIEGNVLRDNGVDLAYVAAAGVGAAENCFAANTFTISVPVDVERILPCGSSSAFRGPSALTAIPAPPGVDYRSMPAPPPQPTMPASAMRSRGGAGRPPKVDLASIPVPS